MPAFAGMTVLLLLAACTALAQTPAQEGRLPASVSQGAMVIGNTSPATIVEVGGQAGHDAQIKRHDGFNKKIKGSKIEVIDYKTPQQWATAEAMAITEDLIVKHGKKIQGVFCHWDNGVTGVSQALKAANMMDGMFIVGVDGNRAGFDQVRKGTQSVTIMQNFEVMSKKSMEQARAVIDGKKVEPITFVPLDIVDAKNIDQFTPPEW